MADPNKFRFSIDRGGTFTDIYAETPKGPRILKLLSENPGHYPDAPLEGIRRIIQEVTHYKSEDISSIEWIRMGTTVATNALLERKGARTALIITQGFGDLLRIGKQNRPGIFDLKIIKPEPLYETVVEIDERVHPIQSSTDLSQPSVKILRSPDRETVRHQLHDLLQQGIESLAIALMHATLLPDHELLVAQEAVGLGFKNISLSSEIVPRARLVDRGHTTCLDAYLNPHIQDYLRGFRDGFSDHDTDLFVMQSDGGLVDADSFTGSRAIFSGPAGGVVGYAQTTGATPVIGFDMGGTSTDVSRFDGNYEWLFESEGNLVPQLNIHTVAAGGGSRLLFENGMFQVGPSSSGAWPGPACYRNGGPLSLTDANLVLGRIVPEQFPCLFGENEDQPLSVSASQRAFTALMENMPSQTGQSIEETAYGFVEVANENMARAIHEITASRGYDARDHILSSFGGAGGQHACAIARALGISKIFISRFAGVLSAYGMGLADVAVDKEEPVKNESEAGLKERLEALADKAVLELKSKGNFTIEVKRYLNMRYEGSDTTLMVKELKQENYEETFSKMHFREFGFNPPKRKILVEAIRVRAEGKSPPAIQTPLLQGQPDLTPLARKKCYFANGWQETPIFLLEKLVAGQILAGPAILIQDTSTILIEPSCTAKISPFGDVEIELKALPARPIGTELDAVQLSLFGSRFMSIAEQMGRVLQRTAVSTNIKERMDFSCAIFGPEGDLVANAPHQPVHLGSMGEAVRHQVELNGHSIKEGQVWVSNHPATGGSHLPDITVITPVIKEGKSIFFVASRGHHADIGGTTPGSMPPFSKSLEEEGASIKSFKLVENNEFQEAGITEILTRAGTRALADNLSDLKAQVSANQKGIALLNELVQSYSLPVVQAYMKHLRDNAGKSVRALLKKWAGKNSEEKIVLLKADDFMDEGSRIVLTVSIDTFAGSACFDFTGSSNEQPNNLNTPRAVTLSAILYCLRCLIDSDIPLNQGCLQPVEVLIPSNSLLAPSDNAAVAAGNVLTSQRITDVIFKAFNACAASQGCMNNLTFGNDHFAYYETIAGGAGAGPDWSGQSAVHTHMTNTRITDPEILEQRYPVLLREFSIRKDSGGKGKFKGGDGVIREIEFLVPLKVAILSERRVYAPYGMNGGGPGEKGKNLLIKKDGSTTDVGGKCQLDVQSGDRIRICTPGGGAWHQRDAGLNER
ncbi:MAG: 5-oxoprolinase [Nitrospina sp.]|jgi:5-oxoprolinase (ATP-hydrolysing)|nr:5-oxoprolinase [Nitrospina sp.]MBT5632357.1 5-oxoprolinase [Nitrospina sp.]